MTKEYTLPDLDYDFGALEPVISGKIMEIHYSRHHKTYMMKLNQALIEYEEASAKNDLEKMIALQSAINFNGGGYINHSIFWKNLTPIQSGGGILHSGALQDAIQKSFGSLEACIQKFTSMTVAIQGSGWGWLGYNKTKKSLELTTCQNQDPLSTKGLVPLLGIDVWEHAYYLQYENNRQTYLDAIWKIINWNDVEGRYKKAL